MLFSPEEKTSFKGNSTLCLQKVSSSAASCRFSESWILNSTLLIDNELESFQAELGKRTLRLHSSSSNRGCRIALHWPSMRARVLCSKFSFLLKVTQGDNSLSCQVFRSLAASEVESIQLVCQCRFLESQYGSNLTSDILTDPMSFSTAALKKDILRLDRSRLLADASTAPTSSTLWMLTPIQSATGSEFGTLPLIVDPMAHPMPWLC